MEEVNNLYRAKIESLLSGFKDLGINQNSIINQSEIIRFLNSRALGGNVDPLLVEKLFQVTNIDNTGSMPITDFVDGYLQFEEEVSKNFDTFEKKLAEEREIFRKLDEQCNRYKNEQLNSEGFCQNARIYGEITDVDVRRKLEGIKEIILIVVYNEKIEEMRFQIGGENSNAILHHKFEFKPTSRKDHFEFIMKGVNDKDQVFDIGSKVFSLEDVTSQDEYAIQILIPEMEDGQTVAAYINAIITVYWSDYKYYDLERRKAAKRLKKLTEAATKAKEFLLKVKEIYGNLSQKREDILVDFNNEKVLQRHGKRIVGIKSKRVEIGKVEKKEEEIQTVPLQVPAAVVEEKTVVKSVPKLQPKYIEIRKKAIEIPAIEPKIEEIQIKEVVLPEKTNKVILTEKVLPEIVRNTQGQYSQEIRESVVRHVSPVKVIETVRPTIEINKVAQVTEINNASYQNALINSEVTLPVQRQVSISPGRITSTQVGNVITTTTQSPTTVINRSLRPIHVGVTISPTKYIGESVNVPIETTTHNIYTQVADMNENVTTYSNEVNYPSQTEKVIYKETKYLNGNVENIYPSQITQTTVNYNDGYDVNSIFNQSTANTVINTNVSSIPFSGAVTERKEIVSRSVNPLIVNNTTNKVIRRSMVLPAIHEYNQGEIIGNHSITGGNYSFNKREEIITENVLPTTTTVVENITSPVITSGSTDNYVDELLKTGVNNNYSSSYANIHVIQNGTNDYDLNLGENEANNALFNTVYSTSYINHTNSNIERTERSSSKGRVSTRITNIRGNQLIDPITGEQILPELEPLNLPLA